MSGKTLECINNKNSHLLLLALSLIHDFMSVNLDIDSIVFLVVEHVIVGLFLVKFVQSSDSFLGLISNQLVNKHNFMLV